MNKYLWNDQESHWHLDWRVEFKSGERVKNPRLLNLNTGQNWPYQYLRVNLSIYSTSFKDNNLHNFRLILLTCIWSK